MTERVAATPGLYPLPDWAKETLSDLKGHQKGDLLSGDESEAIVEQYDEVRAEYVDDQLDAGLDLISEGQGRWDDMIAHPLTVHDGVETGGIVRYYDNNNFYRDPRVVDDLGFSGDVARELESARDLVAGGAADASLAATLPGPYSLAALATDEHYG
ncbi:5-methyltetrahydropteroyltriglutamate--homocysteine methyltransferase, partial [Halorubrum sp. SD626R]